MTASTLGELAALMEEFEPRPAGPSSERRRHPRTPVQGRVPVEVEVPGRGIMRGTLRDLSRGGAGMCLPVPLAVGTRMVLRITAGSRPVEWACRVANCRTDGAGGHRVGVQIIATGSRREAVLALLAIRSPDPSGEGITAAPEACQALDFRDVDMEHAGGVIRRLAELALKKK